MEANLWQVLDILNTQSPFVANITLPQEITPNIYLPPPSPSVGLTPPLLGMSLNEGESFNHYRPFPHLNKGSKVKILFQRQTKEGVEITYDVEYYRGDTGVFINGIL